MAGRQKIFRGRVKSLWLKLWGAIPVVRDHFDSFEYDDIHWIVNFTKKGKCIGVFPECCLVGGRFGDPHRDLIVTALRKNICVLPIALKSTEKWGKPFLKKAVERKIRVSISDPLTDSAELLALRTMEREAEARSPW